MPDLDKAEEFATIASAQRRVTMAAVALAGFKADKGGYPALLAELAPRWLMEVPADPFTDAPLKYASSATGCIVYSVGPNLADDRGAKDDQAKTDDLAARLGDWPEPAPAKEPPADTGG